MNPTTNPPPPKPAAGTDRTRMEASVALVEATQPGSGTTLEYDESAIFPADAPLSAKWMQGIQLAEELVERDNEAKQQAA